MSEQILETSLLFIFLVDIFRGSEHVSEFAILTSAILFILFVLLSLLELVKLYFFGKLRLILLIFIILIVNGSMLSEAILNRIRIGNDLKIHDGVIITEAAYRAFGAGANPYSISYEETLGKRKYFEGNLPSYAAFHYPYSPLMFLVNIPFFALTETIFKVIDMRINLVIFFFLTAFVGFLLASRKTLFLIIFLLNPLFVPLLYYGANDIIILFFFFLLLYFLKIRRETLATITLGLATGTKLLILPLAPLYFLYLFMLSGRTSRPRFLFRQFLLFILVNLIVYIPFLIGSGRDLLDDLVFSWIGSGAGSHPIAGFLGVPQILANFGLISADSTFPFFVFVFPIEAIFLIFAFKIFKKSVNLSTLCILSVLNLIAILAFSRLLQTYYLAFLSQILVLAAFLDQEKKLKISKSF